MPIENIKPIEKPQPTITKVSDTAISIKETKEEITTIERYQIEQELEKAQKQTQASMKREDDLRTLLGECDKLGIVAKIIEPEEIIEPAEIFKKTEPSEEEINPV